MAEEGTPPAAAELLAELNGMKLRALQARAEELGVDDDKLDDAEEKPEVIALIVAKLEEQAADNANASELLAILRWSSSGNSAQKRARLATFLDGPPSRRRVACRVSNY